MGLLGPLRVGILILLLRGLLGQQHRVDVGQDTAGSDGDTAQQLAQLLVVAHSQLDVARDDASLLVVAGSIACQLKNLSCQVLQHGSQVHWGTGTHTAGVLQQQKKPTVVRSVASVITDNANAQPGNISESYKVAIGSLSGKATYVQLNNAKVVPNEGLIFTKDYQKWC